MGTYCRDETPEFRERMDHWLEAIVDLLRARTGGNYAAILLMGGYGRGWGAFVDGADGPQPVNDLDIALVTRGRLDRNALLQLREDATRLVNPDSQHRLSELSPLDLHVDVLNFTVRDFQVLPPCQFHLDIVRSARLLDGEDVLAGARTLVPADLDVADSLMAICNNAMSVSESVAVGNWDGRSTRLNLLIFATKACIMAGAAVLIPEGLYSPLPDERVKALRLFLESDAAAALRAAAPDFADVVERASLDRGYLSAEKIAGVESYFADARRILPSTAAHLLRRVFREKCIFSAADAGDGIARCWTRERMRSAPVPLRSRLKAVVRGAVNVVRGRGGRADWPRRAAVSASAVPLIAALELPPGGAPCADDVLTASVWDLLRRGDVQTPQCPATGFAGWCEAAQAVVGAVKCQNWEE